MVLTWLALLVWSLSSTFMLRKDKRKRVVGVKLLDTKEIIPSSQWLMGMSCPYACLPLLVWMLCLVQSHIGKSLSIHRGLALTWVPVGEPCESPCERSEILSSLMALGKALNTSILQNAKYWMCHFPLWDKTWSSGDLCVCWTRKRHLITASQSSWHSNPKNTRQGALMFFFSCKL